MYRAAIPSQWLLAQMMSHGNPPPPYSVTFYTSGPEIFPIMGLDPSVPSATALLAAPTALDIANMEYSLKKSLWCNKSGNGKKSVSASSNGYYGNNNGGRYKSAVPQNSHSRNEGNTNKQPIGMRNNERNVLDKAPSQKIDQGKECTPIKRLDTSSGMDSKGVKRQLDVSNASQGSKQSVSPLGADSETGCTATKRKPVVSEMVPVEKKCEQSIAISSPLQSPSTNVKAVLPPPNIHKCEPPPKNLVSNDEWDKLSKEIWDTFSANKQSLEMYNRKMRLRDVLYHILNEPFPSCGLYVVGSSMNGFGCDTSDIDMCLMLRHNDIDQKIDAINILRHIQKVFKQCDFVQKVELIRAKVPILKFMDSVSGVEVDLNVNNSVGIRNTHLLNNYSKLDWRVRPLVLVVKLWARACDINDAKNMTISSYSLALMVIHYLQSGVNPPILPCLQKLFPAKFLSDSNIGYLVLDETLHIPPSVNTQSLGELLEGFFDYFTNNFKFEEDAISVRLGKRVPKHTCQFQKSRKNNPGQWRCLSIEEPFDLTNTARSVFDDYVFERVKHAFWNSYNKIKKTKELKSILNS